MSPQEENAAIILNHSQIKPEFLAHSGTFISDMCEKVFRVVPLHMEGPTVEEREPCPDCFDTGEMVTRGYDSSDVQVESCHCPAGKVKR